MRARVGEEIEIFDGAGRSAVGEIESLTRSEVRCRVLRQTAHSRVKHPITLCQAIPKGGNMELIVQKAVELGVSVIQPLITSRTVARPESLGKKQAKWQRIALEACKQCGQNHLPEVRMPVRFSEWIGQRPVDTSTLGIVAALDERAEHLKSLLARAPVWEGVDFLVGPEGDFSLDEYQSAYDAGFQPVSFGDIVMRVETATLYGVSILQHEISWLRNTG
jgi:16S rRNA (uracil1498-N3)-methyltransferase